MKLWLLLTPVLLAAQTNLGFQNGTASQAPPGWLVSDSTPGAGYTAVWQGDCRAARPCAVLASPATPPPKSSGRLLQNIAAAAFRGRSVRLRAWVRLESSNPDARAQLFLQVVRPVADTGFYNDMADRPIQPGDWQACEIWGEVASDAQTIRLGLILNGAGHASLSAVEFAPIEATELEAARTAAHDAIQKQYARLDAAFARGDSAAIARLLQPGAQLRLSSIREPLLDAIQTELRQGHQMTAHSTVRTLRLAGSDAIVTVDRDAADAASNGARHVITVHRDIWTPSANSWLLQESGELSYHWVLPPTSAAAAQPVVAQLQAHAVPISDTQEFLAAFGKSLGDARIVLLGEAAQGTREFTILKERLVAYLVREKGFSVLAAGAQTRVPPTPLFAALDTSSPQAAAESVARVAGNAKVIVSAENGLARLAGALLRGRFPRAVYVAAFTFGSGSFRAVGVADGDSRGLGIWTAPPAPEGSGDAILAAAGFPAFFLDFAAIPTMGPLARWLTEPHLFHELSAYWVLDDPDAALQPVEMLPACNSLFFVDAVHVLQ